MRRAGSLVAILVIQVSGGCDKPGSHAWRHEATVAPPPLPSAEELRERADRTFQRAVFQKPREESLVGIEGTFAPLIVEEFNATGSDSPASFGSISRTLHADVPTNRHWVLSNPTV